MSSVEKSQTASGELRPWRKVVAAVAGVVGLAVVVASLVANGGVGGLYLGVAAAGAGLIVAGLARVLSARAAVRGKSDELVQRAEAALYGGTLTADVERPRRAEVERPGHARPTAPYGHPTVTAERPHLWEYALISGVLTVILGVLILGWPGKSITVAAVLFGVYLLVSGVAQVIFGFTLPVTAGGRILLFLSGWASVVLAVLAFRHFDYGHAYLLLAIWIAVGFIFRGTATAASAISDPGLPGRGWMIFFGVISFIAGIVVLAWPFDSLEILTLVVGSWLVVIGVYEIVEAYGIRKEGKKVHDVVANAVR